LKPLIFTIVDPASGGRTIRACSIPGRRTSTLNVYLPNTLSGMSMRGTEEPTMWCVAGFLGRATPTAVRPLPNCMLLCSVVLNNWPPSSSPYVTLPAPPLTTPSFTLS
jgi:hypothetical protein